MRRAALRLAVAAVAGIAARSGAETPACPTARYIQAPHYAAGTYPSDVALADLDDDGAVDAVVANTGFSPGVSVLMGGGAGAFLPPVHDVAQAVNRVAVARLDSSAHLDIVAAGQSGVKVYRGIGDGTFQDPVSYGSSLSANTLSILDVNGDGTLDLAAGGGFEIDVFPGNGDGTFGSPIVQVNAEYVAAVAFGRFDADDVPDMVVGSASQYIFFYKGNGDGTFAVPVYNLVGEGAKSIAAGDVNGDGKADVVVVTEHSFAVLLSHGDGSFEPVILSPLPLPGGPGLTLGDFHGDGSVVAAFTSGNQSQYAILMASLGNGQFAFERAYQTGYGSQALAAGDVDGDGLLDAVTADMYRDQISVLTNSGGGRLRAIQALPLPSGLAYFAAGDFDGDDNADLAALGGDNAVVTLLGDGQGSFTEFASLDLLFSPNWIEAGDFDGDGNLDLVLTTGYGVVFLLRGHGDGTFADPEQTITSYQIRRSLPVDVNGDSKLDVALVSENPPALAVLLGNGDGSFQLPLQASVPEVPADAAIQDFTGDGVPDAALPIDGPLDLGGSVAFLRGHGDGTFAPAVSFPGGADPAAVASADFDGDGHLDIVLANQAAENIALLLGDGDGGFGLPSLIAKGVAAVGIVAGDLDGDGAADVATVSTIGRVTVLIGLGNGRFQSPVVYPAGLQPSLLRAVSTRASGDPDLIAASPNGSQILVLLNGRLRASIPAAASVVVGLPAVLHASATGYGTVGYQWRKDGAPLSDGGSISGSQTATLTIDPVSFSDAGSYDVLVTDSCASASSAPAPLAVEFADVPTSSAFHDDILAIATAGITGGCGGGNYCPASPVRRDQMAAFLLKSEHGSAYAPPACTGVFADVPCPSPFADWVEQLAAEGVTGGCGSGNYCPSQPVTRAQMAIFLLKTSEGSSYTPPPAVGIFGDVPVGSFAADFIEQLYSRGITGGCSVSPLLYCPGSPVLRQQMATFLVRTFSP